MHFYLAQPIDQAAGTLSPLGWTVQMLERYGQAEGIAWFRPSEAHRMPGQPWNTTDMERVDRINSYALGEADALVALLPRGVPTLGVPVEIDTALALDKPVLLVASAGMDSQSIQVRSWIDRGALLCPMADDGTIQVTVLRSHIDTILMRLLEPAAPPAPDTLLITGEAANATPGKYEGDAGIDLALSNQVKLDPGEYILAPTGVRAAIPHGYFGLITGRSSTWAKYRCDVRQAVIDSGYRGELMLGIENRGDRGVLFAAGTRLGQIVVLPTFGGGMAVVDELPPADRHENGYGSSGI